jgi:beta-lactamase superfamily II metal-dependent hydrolase
MLLDGVDAKRFDETEAAVRDPEALALIRAMSTDRVWQEDHELSQAAKGDWVEIRLNDAGGAPMAWEMKPTDDYRRGPKRSVASIRRIGRPTADGAATGADPELAMRLHSAIKAGPGRRPVQALQNFAHLFMPIGSPDQSDQADNIEIVILDVGQASAAIIKRDGTPIALFDAGSPIWFNKRSLHRRFVPPELDKGVIFLSHWDFDHFDLGRRHPPWRQRVWLAPDQPVGPNTELFQRELGSQLTFVDGPLTIGGFRFERGTCLDPADRNNTGYQLRYERANEAALLTGDADYAHIAPHMISGLTHLCIPHHGGRGTTPPAPVGSLGRAVVSYGTPNIYRHPHVPQLLAHERLGWEIVKTAQDVRPRGDRQLYPTPAGV